MAEESYMAGNETVQMAMAKKPKVGKVRSIILDVADNGGVTVSCYREGADAKVEKHTYSDMQSAVDYVSDKLGVTAEKAESPEEMPEEETAMDPPPPPPPGPGMGGMTPIGAGMNKMPPMVGGGMA